MMYRREPVHLEEGSCGENAVVFLSPYSIWKHDTGDRYPYPLTRMASMAKDLQESADFSIFHYLTKINAVRHFSMKGALFPKSNQGVQQNV